MRKMTTTIILPVLVVIGLWAPTAWSAGVPNATSAQGAHEESEPVITKMLREAKSPADHLNIAAWYDKQAKVAREQARKFGVLSDCYSQKVGAGTTSSVRAHQWCNLQARRYRAAAEEDERLAKMHRAIADQLAKAAKP